MPPARPRIQVGHGESVSSPTGGALHSVAGTIFGLSAKSLNGVFAVRLKWIPIERETRGAFHEYDAIAYVSFVAADPFDLAGKVNSDTFDGRAPGTILIDQINREADGSLRARLRHRDISYQVTDRDGHRHDVYEQISFGDLFDAADEPMIVSPR